MAKELERLQTYERLVRAVRTKSSEKTNSACDEEDLEERLVHAVRTKSFEKTNMEAVSSSSRRPTDSRTQDSNGSAELDEHWDGLPIQMSKICFRNAATENGNTSQSSGNCAGVNARPSELSHRQTSTSNYFYFVLCSCRLKGIRRVGEFWI